MYSSFYELFIEFIYQAYQTNLFIRDLILYFFTTLWFMYSTFYDILYFVFPLQYFFFPGW